jgi:Ankyrin repeats (many copies)/Ankyrin repeat
MQPSPQVQTSMETLLAAIVADDRVKVKTLLRRDAALATRLVVEARLYESNICHWLYVGDTALHLAAAGYRVEIVGLLLDAGANPNAAMNHRRSGPLHYAADGFVTGPAWDAQRQVETIRRLLEAGANVNAQDKNGATPLHRAVRTRCASAVKDLLNAGSDPTLKNKSGSTPFHLAVQDSGRGGTGAAVARTAQRQIIEEFLSRGVSTALQDGNGKSVLECARITWIQDLLSENVPGTSRGA